MDMSAKSLNDLLLEKRDLDPELEEFLVTERLMGQSIRNPLVYSVPPVDALMIFVRRNCA
jgi:hypothetical protein